ncbi:helix-turn-helix domain-containing protein [Levilactobacillus angrenensis]|uniref:Helix-turn-helix domain-containing protein n=1 Tax=Levilactobacillus angrenensis TaxID=2486020 RepID=A0ABW1UBH9_9LACO|nr:helix-turn-helix domain-containing protein [Levilactobacillus angrenensis]
MTSRIVYLEQKAPDNAPAQTHNLFLVGYAIFQVEQGTTLRPALNSWGKVQTIIVDHKDRFRITFNSGRIFVLSQKKVLTYETDRDELTLTERLQDHGLKLPETTPLPTAQTPNYLKRVWPQVRRLTSIPRSYVVIDCEFGVLFKTQRTGDDITMTRTTIAGEKAGIFQLAALGYQDAQPLDIFFNRYLDNPHFSANMKLRGLKETGLTLPQFEQQAQPLAVVRAFIQQVLQRRLPLVFWDQGNDFRLLQNTLALYYEQLTAAERTVLQAPLTVFDGSLYTNEVINRSNHQHDSRHFLPLNGVAGLLNIFNPHQHDALWDAQTTHYVVNALARFKRTTPLILTAPQPAVPLQLPAPKSAPVAQSADPVNLTRLRALRAAGQTYREIAGQLGMSPSTVWRAVKRHQER